MTCRRAGPARRARNCRAGAGPGSRTAGRRAAVRMVDGRWPARGGRRADQRRRPRRSAAGRYPHPAPARVAARRRGHRAPRRVAQAPAPWRGDRGGGGRRAAGCGGCPGGRAADTPQPGNEPAVRRPAGLPGWFRNIDAAICTHLSRTAAARRLRLYRPHRRLREHDRRDRLAGHRQRGTRAVPRVHRWRGQVAAGHAPRTERGPAPGGPSGRPRGRRSQRLAGGWPAVHLDQPQWPVMDTFGPPWHHPQAAGRPDVRAEQHVQRLPGRRRGRTAGTR